METLKAGCFLVNKKDKTIAIIYRENHDDYSFPKGHVEEGETIEEAALRETAEETKREGEIVTKFPPNIEHYTTPKGEECVCYMFIAIDKGPSDNTSTDTHQLIWTPFEEVEKVLSISNLLRVWNEVKADIESLLN